MWENIFFVTTLRAYFKIKAETARGHKNVVHETVCLYKTQLCSIGVWSMVVCSLCETY